MKIKPKEVLINLPIVLMFDTADEIAQFASNINTVLHGKVKVKYEELGILGVQEVGLFYLQRNDEFSELREQFRSLIEAQELAEWKKNFPHAAKAQEQRQWHNDERCLGVAGCMCIDCDPYRGMKP